MVKTKLCPFCGSEVEPAYRSGGVCVVSCRSCRADGPVVMVEDFLDFSEEVTNEAWNEAVEKAKAAAVEKWNTRPPMTDATADELTRYELEWLKKDAASLYGANCREVW